MKDISILYIDDDKTLQNSLAKYFKQMFGKLYQAYDGAEAYTIYRVYKPQVVITEVVLQKKNFFELIADIKSLNPNVIVIVVTKHKDELEIFESFDFGISEIFLKPLDIKKLHKVFMKFFDEPKKEVIKKTKQIKPTTLTVKVEPKKAPPQKEIKKENKPKQIKPTILSSTQKAFVELEKIYKSTKKVVCFNSYKGIVVNQNALLVELQKNSFSLKATNPLLFTMNYEKHTIIQLSNSTFIYAVLLKKYDDSTLIFVKPRFLTHKPRETSYKRLQVDKTFKASISYKNTLYEVKVLNISYEYIIFTMETSLIFFKPSDQIDITLGFHIDAPSSIIKEKQFKTIFANGIVKRLDKNEKVTNCIVNLNIQKAGQSVFTKYLKQRELELVTELKYKIKFT